MYSTLRLGYILCSNDHSLAQKRGAASGHYIDPGSDLDSTGTPAARLSVISLEEARP
jgi:hypothetical protein